MCPSIAVVVAASLDRNNISCQLLALKKTQGAVGEVL